MNLYRPKLGVGTKTLIALSLVFWIPVGALAGLLFHMFQGMMQDEVSDRVQVQLEGARSLLEARDSTLEGVLVQMAHRPDLREALAEGDGGRLQALLADFSQDNTFISLVLAVDANQRVVSRRVGSGGDVFSVGDILPRALASGEVLSANELVSREFLMREDQELTNLVKDIGLVRFVVAPVHQGQEVVGALIGGMLLSADTWLGNSVYSRYGVELALFAGNPREPLFLHATTSLPRSIWALGQVMPESVRHAIELGQAYAGTLDMAGLQISAAFEPLLDSRNRIIGAIGVSTPYREVGGAVMENIVKAIAVTAALALVIALLSVFFVHHDITRPLTLLTEAMRRFGQGDLNTTVELKTGDQLEVLSNGFNEMADGIRKREERFKKHNEVAKLFMSTLDMEQLLDKTLRIVVNVTESQLGILYLWEEEGQCLMPHAQYGTSSELTALELGEGFPGRAAKDRSMLTVHPSESSTEATIDMGFMKSVPCEVVYIPLIYQDSVLGVLVLGSAKHYSEDEVQLFDFLADQISMALDNARMHQRIHELSITDGLTSLHNRRYLNTRLDQEWARSQRHGTSIAVLLSDIDNFKSVNDSYGHDRGDDVLRQVAAIFKRNARKEDLVARYGGEEFVVILPNTSMDAARQMAERICADARAEEYPWMEDRGATLSIGVAAFPEAEFNTAEELIQAADQAMYKAKTGGKDKVELYSAGA